jgi:hypothetical protein
MHSQRKVKLINQYVRYEHNNTKKTHVSDVSHLTPMSNNYTVQHSSYTLEWKPRMSFMYISLKNAPSNACSCHQRPEIQNGPKCQRQNRSETGEELEQDEQ